MNISELQAKADRLERELRETRELLARETHDPQAVTAELTRSRAYAFNAQTSSVEDIVAGCSESIDRYGFCVLDNVIPADQVNAIRDEIVAAEAVIGKNIGYLRMRAPMPKHCSGAGRRIMACSCGVCAGLGMVRSHPTISPLCRNTPST